MIALAKKRIALGVSQNRLARRAGVAVGTLSKWESGRPVWPAKRIALEGAYTSAFAKLEKDGKLLEPSEKHRNWGNSGLNIPISEHDIVWLSDQTESYLRNGNFVRMTNPDGRTFFLLTKDAITKYGQLIGRALGKSIGD